METIRRIKLTLKQQLELVELYKTGAKVRELALQFDILEITVLRYVRKHGIEVRTRYESCKKYSSEKAALEGQKLKTQEWRAANKDRVAKVKQAYRENGGMSKLRRRALLKTYGLTLDLYEAMLEQQNYCCDICQESLKTGRGTNVDHCHKTGKTRGLLCRTCNLLLGCAKDRTEILSKAILYLDKFEPLVL